MDSLSIPARAAPDPPLLYCFFIPRNHPGKWPIMPCQKNAVVHDRWQLLFRLRKYRYRNMRSWRSLGVSFQETQQDRNFPCCHWLHQQDGSRLYNARRAIVNPVSFLFIVCLSQQSTQSTLLLCNVIWVSNKPSSFESCAYPQNHPSEVSVGGGRGGQYNCCSFNF